MNFRFFLVTVCASIFSGIYFQTAESKKLSVQSTKSSFYSEINRKSVVEFDKKTKDLVSKSWLAQIQESIEKAEYNIHYQDEAGALQSPNRKQNLRFTYYSDGFSMKTRNDSLGVENWEIKLTLDGVYRADEEKISPIKNPIQEIENNHLQYHHENGLSIEYKNDLSGMRQNFILNEKPEGDGQLSVLLNLDSELKAMLSSEKELVFAEENAGNLENKVRYKDLKVFDANGKILDSKMELKGNTLALVVNDENASYPITIDPLSIAASALVESNQAYASMGYSVSSAGDVNGDGYSDVIVGAYQYDNGQISEGAAFVYHGSASGISTSAAVIVESNQAIAYMGISVSSAGDVNGDGYSDVIVGAYGYANGETDEGGAFVYHGSASGISTSAAAMVESNMDFIIYPNPAIDVLNIDYFGEMGEFEVEIVDINGKTMFKKSFNQVHTKLDVSAFAQGVYFVQMSSKFKSIVKKVIIK